MNQMQNAISIQSKDFVDLIQSRHPATAFLEALGPKSADLSIAVEVGAGESPPLSLWGLDEADVQRAKRATVLELVTPHGGMRYRLARTLHRTEPHNEGVFLILDAASDGVGSALSALASALMEVPLECDCTIFLENSHKLPALFNRDFQNLISILNRRDTASQLILGRDDDAHSGVPMPGDVSRLCIAELSERRRDILKVIDYFLRQKHCAPRFEAAADAALLSWSWPGDIEETEHLASRIAMTARHGDVLTGDEVRALLDPKNIDVNKSLADVEKEHIHRVLDAQGWNRTRAARALGIDVKTLYNKLKRYETRRQFDRNSQSA